MKPCVEGWEPTPTPGGVHPQHIYVIDCDQLPRLMEAYEQSDRSCRSLFEFLEESLNNVYGREPTDQPDGDQDQGPSVPPKSGTAQNPVRLVLNPNEQSSDEESVFQKPLGESDEGWKPTPAPQRKHPKHMFVIDRDHFPGPIVEYEQSDRHSRSLYELLKRRKNEDGGEPGSAFQEPPGEDDFILENSDEEYPSPIVVLGTRILPNQKISDGEYRVFPFDNYYRDSKNTKAPDASQDKDQDQDQMRTSDDKCPTRYESDGIDSEEKLVLMTKAPRLETLKFDVEKCEAVRKKSPKKSICSPNIVRIFLAIYAILIAALIYLVFLEKTQKTCTSDICAEAANFLVHRINQTVDPCEDFYTHACGRFYDEKFDEYSSIRVTSDRNNRDIIENWVISSRLPTPEETWKLLEDKCRNWKKFKNGRIEMLEEIAKIGKWPMLDPKWKETDFDLTSFMAGMQDIGMFNYGIFRLRLYSSDSERKLVFKRTRMKGLMKDAEKILSYLVGKNKSITEDMKDLEKFYAELQNSSDYAFDYSFVLPFKNDDYKSLKDLKNTFPEVNWEGFLNDFVFGNYDGKVKWEDRIRVVPEFFEGKFAEIIQRGMKNQRVFANYLIYEFVSQYIGFMAPDVQNGFGEKNMTEEEIHEKCRKNIFNLMMAMSDIIPTDRLIENDNFDAYSRLKESIKIKFIELIDNENTWLEDETKRNMKLQIVEMHIKIVNSEKFKNEETFKRLYGQLLNVEEQFSYFKSIMNVKKWRMLIERAQIAGNYTFHFGEASAQIPLLNTELPKYYNYGKMGLAIGQEIGRGLVKHATDSEKLPEFAYPSKNRLLDHRFCFKSHSDAFPVEDGLKPLAELDLMADHIGMAVMYEMAKELENPPKLPGFENQDQMKMFFYSYAVTRCNGGMSKNGLNDNKLRVNSVVSSFEEFGKSFECNKGSMMYPEKQCKFF